MITSLSEDTDYRLDTCPSSAVTSIDLNEEMEEMEDEGVGYETYRIAFRDGTDRINGSLLWVPAAGRAGIVVNGAADWFDADSPDDAVSLWLSGDWTHFR